MGKGGIQTLYFGAHPSLYRISDKVAESKARYQRSVRKVIKESTFRQPYKEWLFQNLDRDADFVFHAPGASKCADSIGSASLFSYHLADVLRSHRDLERYRLTAYDASNVYCAFVVYQALNDGLQGELQSAG